jgi:hypothetical protein
MSDVTETATDTTGKGAGGAGAATLGGQGVASGASNGAAGEAGKASGANGKAANGSATPNTDHWAYKFASGVDEELSKEWLPTASRYLTPADKIKADLELRKSAVFIPRDDAKPEAWDAVYDKLGRPKVATEYKWNHLADAPALEDPDIAVRDSFGNVAHRVGMNQKQLDATVQWHDMNRKVQTDAFIARANQTAETYTKTLKSTFGPDYDRTIALHSTAVKTYAGNDLQALASLRLEDGTFVLDHPSMVGVFSKIGAERAEDTRFAATFNPSGVAGALAEIEKIEQEAVSKGVYPTSAGYPHDKLKPLYAIAHGGKMPMRGTLRGGS